MDRKPVTHRTPIPLLDFHSWKVRKEYTPAAACLLFRIMAEWHVGEEDSRNLLGVSNRYYHQLKARPEGRILSEDRIYRVPYLIGIYKALHILYGPELADRFVQLPNANQLFGAMMPLRFMIEGGQPAMQRVRRLVDAGAAGNW